jgi:hypothetical protein
MRLCFCLAVLAATLAGCDDLPSVGTSRVLEVHCVHDTGLDVNQRCTEIERSGAELEIKVNASTQKVLISIVKNDGDWFIRDILLDMCSVVDGSNWRCHDKPIGTPGQLMYMITEYGMAHGRYYKTLTGGAPPDYYTSSISSLTFWELHYGLITWADALANTGYSAQVVALASKRQ